MNSRRFVLVLLLAAGFPALGLLGGGAILMDFDAGLTGQGLPPAATLCAGGQNGAFAVAAETYCGTYFLTRYLVIGSLVALLWGLAIPLLFRLAAGFAGYDRRRLAIVFPPLVRLSLVLMSVSILLQGAVLAYGIVVADYYLVGRVNYVFAKIVGVVGLGALFASWQLISTLFKSSKKLDMTVAGLPLTPDRAPRLFGLVEGLAAGLEAEPPDHIILGLEPTFYVTSADVQVIGSPKPLTGETLYVSASLARLLSQEELSAVIGHELGHFRGEDTAYSLKFMPVYAGLSRAIEVLEDSRRREGRSLFASLAAIPAAKMLGFMLEVFAHSERAIAREREHQADAAGAEAASPIALATALAKVALYSAAWGEIQQDNVQRLAQGKITGNLSRIFESAARYDIDQKTLDNVLAYVADRTIAHPTDSHPPVGARLAWLGVAPSAITKDMLTVPAESAIALIDDAETGEEQLTVLEHKLMVAMGYVEPPDGKAGQDDYLLQTTYALAAAMVTADGRIEQEEIHAAEAIGAELFKDFDPVDFREACSGHDELPAAGRLAGLLRDLLDDDQKMSMFRYLNAIAVADGHVDPKEQVLLDQLAATLGLSIGRRAQAV